MGTEIDLRALDDLNDEYGSFEGWIADSKRVPLAWLMLFEEKSLAFPWVTDGGHKVPVLHTERLPALQRFRQRADLLVPHLGFVDEPALLFSLFQNFLASLPMRYLRLNLYWLWASIYSENLVENVIAALRFMDELSRQATASFDDDMAKAWASVLEFSVPRRCLEDAARDRSDWYCFCGFTGRGHPRPWLPSQ